jgi:hypothetical protein
MTNGLCYRQEARAGIKILEVYVTEDGSHAQVDMAEKTIQELSLNFETSRQCCLRLIVITRSWRTGGTSHQKLAYYNITQKEFSRILDIQGLTSFFCRTRVDVTGLFNLLVSHLHDTDPHDGQYFALIYDAFLGLWARYDRKCKQWQGILTVTETYLDLNATAEQLLGFVHTEMFLYRLAAQYTVDFLGLGSGELPRQIAEIELHSTLRTSDSALNRCQRT